MLEETPESLRGAIPVSQEFAVDKRRLKNVKALGNLAVLGGMHNGLKET